MFYLIMFCRSWNFEEFGGNLDFVQVIRASKSDQRLANNDLPEDIQRLRCRVHYDALRFSHRPMASH